MKKLLIFLLALSSIGVAVGAGTTANLAWTAPTAYLDGTTLPAADIAFYTVSYTFAGQAQTKVVNAPSVTTTVPVPCGGTTFSVSITTKSTAVYPNATSGSSNQVPYASGVSCVPNAPSNLTAN